MDVDSPIVEEVRRRRHELSERFDHDLRKYGEHVREVEREYQDRVVSQVTVVRSPQREKPEKPE